MSNRILSGLYAITDSQMGVERDLPQLVEQALKGGAKIVQYRDKSSDHNQRLADASSLLDLCQRHSACFIINDDVELAAAVAADGVHLGRDDADIDSARRRLGDQAIIGVSCYNRLDLATAAQDAGVNYVAFGRFFPSSTKPQAVQAETELLIQAKQTLHIPIVAIGGITPENGASLIDAGADMLAVIHGLFGQSDVRAAAEQFNQQFAQKD
ncbi:MAG: thiamine phosphate synthase [Gammaproteobacteria bacterium]|nr:thiamine phosphate synthase [Gammaproteobacteria bacterium]